jgi:hypothetical protein
MTSSMTYVQPYSPIHSLLQPHFKFPTSLTIANAHHMLLLQLFLQQQAALVTCMQCFHSTMNNDVNSVRAHSS